MRRPEIVHDLVERLASADGVEPHELSYAIHDHVDTSTLAGLGAMDDVQWQVSFDVPRHDVELYSDGRIVVDGSAVGGESTVDTPDS